MAVYNGEKYILKQLESILDQLGEEDEVIISDDGSSDKTVSLIQSQADDRLRFFQQKKRLGYTGNFEFALTQAEGEFIFLSDQDDVWMPGRVARMLEELRIHDFVVCNAQIVNSDATEFSGDYFSFRKVRPGFFANFLRIGYLGCCMSMRRTVLKYALPIPRQHKLTTHDAWLSLFAEAFFHVKLIETPLMYYRRHGTNTSTGGKKSQNSLLVMVVLRLYPLMHLALRTFSILLLHTKNGLNKAVQFVTSTYYRSMLTVERARGNSEVKKQKRSETVVRSRLKNFTGMLLFTHRLGGGTEVYVRSVLLKEYPSMIRIVPISRGTSIGYRVENNEGQSFGIVGSDVLFEALVEARPQVVVVNSLVSFSETQRVFQSISEFKQRGRTHIVYMVHDYHSVCPQYTLTAEGKFCGLACNRHNCDLTVPWLYNSESRIEKWREQWLAFFGDVTEIRCFSDSSRNIFLSVYNTVPPEKVTVVPHKLEYFNSSQTNPIPQGPMRIGVIGSCSSIPKGREVVRELLKYGKNNKYQIEIFGKFHWWHKTHSSLIKYHGKYQNAELVNKLNSSGINVVLFPSVWPETFSYIVSEVIQIGLPIVCFNMGAQADKVSKYHLGSVVENFGLPSILEGLTKAYALGQGEVFDGSIRKRQKNVRN